MKYLMIENDSVAPVESFTILGLSTARGSQSKIGQFGTGAKHGVNVLLRNGLSPVIYFGTTKMEFLTKKKWMGDTPYEQVYYTLDGGRATELSWSTDFGGIDWKHTAMALREFISNAFDESGIVGTNIEIVDNPRAKSGYTRVFVPVNREVQSFFDDIGTWFLQFGGKDSERIITKSSSSKAMVYRKGVLVRQLKYRPDSLFDYNFGDELPIDESRNLHDYTVISGIGSAVANDKNAIKEVLRAISRREVSLETELDYYSLSTTSILKDAWDELYGEDTYIAQAAPFVDLAERKGFRAVQVLNEGWYKHLEAAGVKTAVNLAGSLGKRGLQEMDPTPNAIVTLNKVWQRLLDVNATEGKEKPPVKVFSKMMNAGEVLRGLYERGVVYINVDNDSDESTMLEELAHYITGASDNSRDFQDFAFHVATRAFKLTE